MKAVEIVLMVAQSNKLLNYGHTEVSTPLTYMVFLFYVSDLAVNARDHL